MAIIAAGQTGVIKKYFQPTAVDVAIGTLAGVMIAQNLALMAHRALALAGVIQIDSTPGGGVVAGSALAGVVIVGKLVALPAQGLAGMVKLNLAPPGQAMTIGALALVMVGRAVCKVARLAVGVAAVLKRQ